MILIHFPKSECPRDMWRSAHRGRVGKPPGNRRGSLLAEVGISTVVLTIVMGLTVKVLGTIAQERRAASERQQGTLEAGNLMERITAYPFDQVTPELARSMSVSDLASSIAARLRAGDRSQRRRQERARAGNRPSE